MHISNSTFNIIKQQFGDTSLITQDPVSEDVLGAYIEQIIDRSGNHRLGLEKGFTVPITIAGMLYKIYENCATLKEVFEKSDAYTPAINPLYSYINRVEENTFVHEIVVEERFTTKYPLAGKQLYECQLGISLQILYTLTGKRIKPIEIHTLYEPEDLSTYVKCPIFRSDKFALSFDRSILDLPILTANNRLLHLIEKLINETQDDGLSASIRSYLLQCLPTVDFDIKNVARKQNLSERTLQRRLRQEKTSFREILNRVRIELSEKYIKEDIPFVEVAFLLGFDSQSAFNKFFHKHFKTPPSQYKKKHHSN